MSGSRLSSKIRKSAADAAMKLIWMPDWRPTSATRRKRPTRNETATNSGPAMSLIRWNAGMLKRDEHQAKVDEDGVAVERSVLVRIGEREEQTGDRDREGADIGALQPAARLRRIAVRAELDEAFRPRQRAVGEACRALAFLSPSRCLPGGADESAARITADI